MSEKREEITRTLVVARVNADAATHGKLEYQITGHVAHLSQDSAFFHDLIANGCSADKIRNTFPDLDKESAEVTLAVTDWMVALAERLVKMFGAGNIKSRRTVFKESVLYEFFRIPILGRREKRLGGVSVEFNRRVVLPEFDADYNLYTINKHSTLATIIMAVHKACKVFKGLKLQTLVTTDPGIGTFDVVLTRDLLATDSIPEYKVLGCFPVGPVRIGEWTPGLRWYWTNVLEAIHAVNYRAHGMSMERIPEHLPCDAPINMRVGINTVFHIWHGDISGEQARSTVGSSKKIRMMFTGMGHAYLSVKDLSAFYQKNFMGARIVMLSIMALLIGGCRTIVAQSFRRTILTHFNK